MLLKTGHSPPPPKPKVEGHIIQFDDVPPEEAPVGYVITGWSDGTQDGNILPPSIRIEVNAPRTPRRSTIEPSILQFARFNAKRLAQRREAKQLAQKRIAAFLDKINRKERK